MCIRDRGYDRVLQHLQGSPKFVVTALKRRAALHGAVLHDSEKDAFHDTDIDTDSSDTRDFLKLSIMCVCVCVCVCVIAG